MIAQVRSHWTHAAAVAVLTAVLHTWPLATDPAHLSLHYNADAMLNEWIVAWVQHQLVRAPFQLFDANIFHPAPDALAFSEPLIVPALLGAPVRAAGGSPVLVHNLLLLAGLAVTMLAGYALAYHWTGDRLASLLAGTAWTFNTHSLMRLEHLQAAHAYGIPLAILAADKLITTGQVRYAGWLSACMVLMAYTSGHLVIFAATAVTVLLAARVPEWWGRARHLLVSLTLAAIAAGIVILPVYLPYRRVAIDQGMRRPLESVWQFSATLDGYAASYSRLHHWLWNAGAPREFPDAFFPGILVVALALAGLWTHMGREPGPVGRTRVIALLALATTGLVLSLGTRTPVYGWLYEVFAPLSALRAAGRFGVLFLLSVAMLAGLGLAALRVRAGANRRFGAALGVAALVTVNLEALRAPYRYVPFQGISPVYELLAKDPSDVVLVEVPFHLPETIFQNAEYVLNSTAHWRKLMNGYSGYTPATYREYVRVFWNFPDRESVEAMRAAGATHLMVHPQRYGREAADTLRQALANPRLERLAVGADNLTLFRIR